jgi:signal transduction histidine kinase
MRDLITICRGNLELITDVPKQSRTTIALVMGELDRMAMMVDKMQLLAEAEQSDFLQLERIDLKAFTHELTERAAALGARRWMVDYIADGVAIADHLRLTEAVLQLAHNAVQHTGAEDVIAIGTSVGEKEWRLWVRDTGTGIAEPDQELIFEHFARGAPARRRNPGDGLGLSIVKAIIDAHGGQVELISHRGEGSTFMIVLPRRSAEEIARA